MKTKPWQRYRRKAEMEAERLTEVWCASHPAEMEERELSRLNREHFNNCRPMERIRNEFCLAHATGKPCKCKESPEYPEAAAMARFHEPALAALHARRRILRTRVRDGYLSTILRGMRSKGLLSDTVTLAAP